MYVYIAHYQN